MTLLERIRLSLGLSTMEQLEEDERQGGYEELLREIEAEESMSEQCEALGYLEFDDEHFEGL